jgi:hypothetical protein
MSSFRSRAFATPLRSVIVWTLVLTLGACEAARTPQHYFIPDGFNGWAYVKYDDPSCPPLEMREGLQTVRIPSSGRVCTSSPYETGKAREVWEYVRADGTTRPLDYGTEISLSSLHEPGHFVQFLVGSAKGATPDPSPLR